MPKLTELLAEKANADIQVGAATVKVQFYVFWRERFTDEEWSASVSTDVPRREQLKRVLPRVILTWDITDNDEHVIPVTADAIDQHRIPDAMLLEIWLRATGSDLSGKAISMPSQPT